MLNEHVTKLYLTHRGEPELARIVLDDGAIVLCLDDPLPAYRRRHAPRLAAGLPRR